MNTSACRLNLQGGIIYELNSNMLIDGLICADALAFTIRLPKNLGRLRPCCWNCRLGSSRSTKFSRQIWTTHMPLLKKNTTLQISVGVVGREEFHQIASCAVDTQFTIRMDVCRVSPAMPSRLPCFQRISAASLSQPSRLPSTTGHCCVRHIISTRASECS